LVQQQLGMPWMNYNAKSGQTFSHWEKLAMDTALIHPRGRLYQFASSLGVWGSIVGAAITIAMLAALAWTTIGLCGSAGVVTAKAGVLLGIWQGGCIALLVACASLVTSLSVKYPITHGHTDHWRVTRFGLAQTAVTLIVFCAAVGVVHGLRRARRAKIVTDSPVA
jgi:hypothetical protein